MRVREYTGGVSSKFEEFLLLKMKEPRREIILGIISAERKRDTISRPLGCLCCFELREEIDVNIVEGDTPALNLKNDANADINPSIDVAYEYGRSSSVTSLVNC